jgi:hypothetical protein
MPSLTNQAIQYYSCFISYSSRDQDFGDRIHADLHFPSGTMTSPSMLVTAGPPPTSPEQLAP